MSFTEYVNGSFMETGPELREAGYTYRELTEIEEALLWYEENLRYPQINSLQGVGFGAPESQTNQRWMRVFTTLTLTHSNGYVLYWIERNTGTHLYHDRIWYGFWDAPLGRPVKQRGSFTKTEMAYSSASLLTAGRSITGPARHSRSSSHRAQQPFQVAAKGTPTPSQI